MPQLFRDDPEALGRCHRPGRGGRPRHPRSAEEEQFFATITTVPELRVALERMWPILTAEELLHDLFGAPALLRLAADGILDDDERQRLGRPRAATVASVESASADLALLDEAAMLLGPVPRRARRRQVVKLRENARWMIEETIDDIALQTGDLDAEMRRTLLQRLTEREEALLTDDDDDDEPTVYGHLIIDEAQDCSPMQWRMLARRCPTGSMTIVGDLGQASRPGASDPVRGAGPAAARREPRQLELSVNYRTPMGHGATAAAVLEQTDPGLEPPALRSPFGCGAALRRGRRRRRAGGGGGRPRRTAPQRAGRREDRRDRRARAAGGAPTGGPGPRRRRRQRRCRSAGGHRRPLRTDGGQGPRVRRGRAGGTGGARRRLGGRTQGALSRSARATRFLAVVHHRPLPAPLVPAAAAAGTPSAG